MPLIRVRPFAVCAIALLAAHPLAAQTDELAVAGAARLRLQQAIVDGDQAAVVALFTDSALVRTGRATFRGRDAIALALAGFARVRRGRLSMGAEHFDPCTDGAVEWGGSFSFFGTDTPDTVRGTYAILWRREGGELRIHALTLGGSTATPRLRCPISPNVAGYRAARLAATAVFPLLGRSSVGPSIADEMDRRGYPNRNVDSASGAENLSHDGKTPVMISVRVRALAPVWIEGLASLTSYGSTSRRMIGSMNWRAAHDSRAFALLAGYEWRTVRVSAGPALVRSTWRMRWRGPNVEGDSATFTASSAGIAGQAALFYPASRRVVFELRGTLFRVAKTDLPALGGMAAVPGVSNNLAVASLGLGLVF